MSNIFARSPYFINISGVANDETEVHLYIWNGIGAAPGTPTRILAKPIPTSLITEVSYNISPFLREYLAFETSTATVNYTGAGLFDVYAWCNVTVKTYLNGVLGSTTTYKVFDGYTDYLSGYNKDRGDIHLDEGTYYYYYDSVNALATYDSIRPGSINLITGTGSPKVKYTNLDTAATTTITLTASRVTRMQKVYVNYYGSRCKTELLDNANNVLATYYFYPIEECKYNVITVDFVNKYGSWERTFMYKASRTSLEYQGTNYNLSTESVDYIETYGTKAVYNVNFNESISCNTGWVNEDYSDVMRQLLASERVILSGLEEFGSGVSIPVRLKTKQLNVQKHINEKLINYPVDFEYAFDGVQNVQ